MSIPFGFIGGDTGSPGGGGFNPTAYGTCLFSAKANTNVYKDAGQSAAALLYGDLAYQWRDEREAAGGSAYPYLQQSTSGNRPFASPAGTAVGAVFFGPAKNMAFSGLSGVAADNCTLIVVGCLAPDYGVAFDGGGYLQMGTTFATGVMLGNGGLSGTTIQAEPDAYYDSALQTAGTVPIGLGISVLSLTSKGGAVMANVNGTDATPPFPGATTHSESNGYVGDDARLTGNNANAWVARVLVYSPALSASDLAAVVAGLRAEATLNGLWPLTYPLVAYHGNSLTLGRGHGAGSAAQTYPYQCNALLTNPLGFLFAAYSGQTTAQLSAAHAAGIDAHYKSTRAAPQVVVFWEGHNDITAGGLNANQIYAGYVAYGQARKARGYKVILIDIMNAGDFTAGQVTTQGNFNTLLKADFNVASGQTNIYKPANGITYADLLIDIQAETHLQNTADATYFSDTVHLTPTGYGVVASYVKNALGLVGVT